MSDFPPPGPIRDNVDIHLTRRGMQVNLELYAMLRVEEGQEKNVGAPILAVTFAADRSVAFGSDEWFSYFHYMADPGPWGFSPRVHDALRAAGQLGLSLAGYWWEGA